jgi:hypothetical protein
MHPASRILHLESCNLDKKSKAGDKRRPNVLRDQLKGIPFPTQYPKPKCGLKPRLDEEKERGAPMEL